ncbi:MAG: hypothetical protein ABSA94_21540, partial [Acidobacteriaceae bacterium]
MTGSPWRQRFSATILCGLLIASGFAQSQSQQAPPQTPPATPAQTAPEAPAPATAPAPAPTPTIAQQAQQIQLQSIGPQQPFHVEMPKSHLNPLFPYRPSKAPELD